jgi:hypothetical protein
MNELRKPLDIAMQDAPPLSRGVDDIVNAGHRRWRRRRAQRFGGAGLVAVVVVAAALVIGNNPRNIPTNHPNTAIQPAAPAAPAVARPLFTYVFDAYSAGAFRVERPSTVTLTYQEASIVTDYRDSAGKTVDGFVGSLTVYQPGVTPPAVFTQGTEVMVHGMRGFANERRQDSVTGIAPVNGMNIVANTLAWQYDANSWVVINSLIDDPALVGHRLTATDERALADQFTLGTPTSARIPFQATYLPAGWTVVRIDGRGFTGADQAPAINVIFARVSPATAHQIRHYDDPTDGTAVEISVLPRQNPGPPDAPATKKTCIANYGDIDIWCSWDIAHTNYSVVVHDPAMRLSEQELTKIGLGLVFDNLDNPDTWHSAS